MGRRVSARSRSRLLVASRCSGVRPKREHTSGAPPPGVTGLGDEDRNEPRCDAGQLPDHPAAVVVGERLKDEPVQPNDVGIDSVDGVDEPKLQDSTRLTKGFGSGRTPAGSFRSRRTGVAGSPALVPRVACTACAHASSEVPTAPEVGAVPDRLAPGHGRRRRDPRPREPARAEQVGEVGQRRVVVCTLGQVRPFTPLVRQFHRRSAWCPTSTPADGCLLGGRRGPARAEWACAG
jgi:hypothetical protein